MLMLGHCNCSYIIIRDAIFGNIKLHIRCDCIQYDILITSFINYGHDKTDILSSYRSTNCICELNKKLSNLYIK